MKAERKEKVYKPPKLNNEKYELNLCTDNFTTFKK